MLYSNFTEEFLRLQDAIATKIEKQNILINFQLMNEKMLLLLLVICGELTMIYPMFGLKMPLESLINITGYVRWYGRLRTYENKNKKCSVNLIVVISNIPDSLCSIDLNILKMKKSNKLTLCYSVTLSRSHFYKEKCLEILDSDSSDVSSCIGLILPNVAVFLNLKSVLKPLKTGLKRVLSIPLISVSLTGLPKDITTKLKFLT